MKFVPQFNSLCDFRDNRPAQQGGQLFHGWVWHQGFFQCQDQQFVLAGGVQSHLSIRVFQIVLLADDGAYETADFLVGQAVMSQQKDSVAGQFGVSPVHIQMLRTGQHATIDRRPFQAHFQQFAVVQVGYVELALKALGMGDSAESGGGLPVHFQGLDEILLRQGRALGLDCPVAQVGELLGLCRVMAQAVREQGVCLIKCPFVHFHTPHQAQRACVTGFLRQNLIQVVTAFLPRLETLNQRCRAV